MLNNGRSAVLAFSKSNIFFALISTLSVLGLCLYYVDDFFWESNAGVLSYLSPICEMSFAISAIFYTKTEKPRISIALLFLTIISLIYFLGPYIHSGIGIDTGDGMYTTAYTNQVLALHSATINNGYVSNFPIAFLLFAELQLILSIPTLELALLVPFLNALLVPLAYLIALRISRDTFLSFCAAMVFALGNVIWEDVLQRLVVYYVLAMVFLLVLFIAQKSNDGRFHRPSMVLLSLILIPLLYSEALGGFPIALGWTAFLIFSSLRKTKLVERLYKPLGLVFSISPNESAFLTFFWIFSTYALALSGAIPGLLVSYGIKELISPTATQSTFGGILFKGIVLVFAVFGLLQTSRGEKSSITRSFFFATGIFIVMGLAGIGILQVPGERLAPFYFIFLLPLTVLGIYHISLRFTKPRIAYAVPLLSVILIGILAINNPLFVSYYPAKTSSFYYAVSPQDMASVNFLTSRIVDKNVFYNPEWSGMVTLYNASWNPLPNDTFQSYNLTTYDFVIWQTNLYSHPPYIHWSTITPSSVFRDWNLLYITSEMQVYQPVP